MESYDSAYYTQHNYFKIGFFFLFRVEQYSICGGGNGNPLQYSCLENPIWRSLVGCGPSGREESDTTERLRFHFSLSCIGEGNGNPLQCSGLKNPKDGGAWCTAVYGVAQSRTRLKQLSSSSSSILFVNLPGCLPSLLLTDIQVISSFCLLQIKLL